MIEIRFHGRGGQGAVVASEILATAFFKEGKHVQAFPTFGVERRGAPVSAFVRVSNEPIRLRCQIQFPDHVVILDPTLIPVVDVTSGLKPDGWILINCEAPPEHFSRFRDGGWRVATVDASAVAIRNQLGTHTNPIVNTAVLGAFASLTGLIQLDSVLEAIFKGVPGQSAPNLAAAREAAASVRILSQEGVTA